MKKVVVYFKEVNYGSVEIEVNEKCLDYEKDIIDKAYDAIAEGDDVCWGKTNSEITDWEFSE